MKQPLFHCLAIIVLVVSTFKLQAQPRHSNQPPAFSYAERVPHDVWVQSIAVSEPAYGAAVTGNVTVRFTAPGMTVANAFCWQQPTTAYPNPWGHDMCLTPKGVVLEGNHEASFVFPTDEYPHGPLNVRILAQNKEGKRDICELQLYNRGGVKWNEGMPQMVPPAAKGMKTAFADDFTEPLSISRDGRGARYNAHKPRFGDFSGWPFSDPSGANNPFEQVDTYLRIKARKPQGTRGFTGLIASVDMDGKGFFATAPAYLECRFIAQSAPGTWPAFWTITRSGLESRSPADELDIVEAYGGVGPKNPNHSGYSIVSHFWKQKNEDGTPKKDVTRWVPMLELGGRSYWSTTFHVYGLLIGREETIYYFDDMEVLRHPTNELSQREPHFFLVNLAIGGISGWKIDLERYGNLSDMYIDYIRVYQGE